MSALRLFFPLLLLAGVIFVALPAQADVNCTTNASVTFSPLGATAGASCLVTDTSGNTVLYACLQLLPVVNGTPYLSEDNLTAAGSVLLNSDPSC